VRNRDRNRLVRHGPGATAELSDVQVGSAMIFGGSKEFRTTSFRPRSSGRENGTAGLIHEGRTTKYAATGPSRDANSRHAAGGQA
jgi:hypothetical protein